MSTTVRSFGFIAVLLNPVSDHEDLSESLWEAKSTLRLNYEGTLLHSDACPRDDREDFYGLTFGNLDTSGMQDFANEAMERGLAVDFATIKPYNCIWYNGGDSPVDMLTLEEFEAKL